VVDRILDGLLTLVISVLAVVYISVVLTLVTVLLGAQLVVELFRRVKQRCSWFRRRR